MQNSEPQKNENSEDKKVDLSTEKWEQIGFHRALGGWFHNLIITVFGILVGLLTVNLIYEYLYPYPEIKGYNGIAGAFFFSLIYTVFDLGTAYGIQRFIAEYRVKDPTKMIEYVQFFVWYQMLTGLIQITVIPLIVFRLNNTYIYLSWIFLITSIKQYPGMLGTFRAVLEGLQYYNKVNILKFLGDQVFQNITNIIFIIAGRAYGVAHPEIGGLMGACYGAAIGGYIDDFFAMAVSLKWLGKALEPFGVTTIDLWRPNFSKEVAIECIKMGAPLTITPFVNSATGTLMLVMYVAALPQYSAFKEIAALAAGLVGFVNVGNFNTTPLIAESYMNGKEELARYYITTSIRWNGYLMWMLVSILLAFLPMVLRIMLALPGLENYQYAEAFIIPMLIHTLFRPYIDFPNGILMGTGKTAFYTFVRVFEEGLQVFFIWFYLYGVELQKSSFLGINGVVFILAFEHFFPRIIKMIMCWVYINKKLLKININWWQTLVGPLICSVAVFFVGQLWEYTIFNPLFNTIGPIPTAIVTILFGIMVIPFLVYLPLTGYLGVWDDFGIEIFKKAVVLSGPSKFLINLFYNSTIKGIKHSPYHNRFQIPWEQASQEIEELMAQKQSMDEQLFSN